MCAAIHRLSFSLTRILHLGDLWRSKCISITDNSAKDKSAAEVPFLRLLLVANVQASQFSTLHEASLGFYLQRESTGTSSILRLMRRTEGAMTIKTMHSTRR